MIRELTCNRGVGCRVHGPGDLTMDSMRLAPNGSVFPQIPCCRCEDNTRAWDRLAGKTYCPNCMESLAVGEAEPVVEKTERAAKPRLTRRFRLNNFCLR